MIAALILTASLAAAPAPSHSFVTQVDAHLKAAFARVGAVAQARPAPHLLRQGRAPRPLGR